MRELSVGCAIFALMVAVTGCGGGGGGGTTTIDPPTEPGQLSISSITATPTGPSTATITWRTSEAAACAVDYGTTESYGQTKNASTDWTSHTISLDSLSPNTTYHFRIRANASGGRTAESSDQGFTTLIVASGGGLYCMIDDTEERHYKTDAGAYIVPVPGPTFASNLTLFGRIQSQPNSQYVAIHLEHSTGMGWSCVFNTGGENYVQVGEYRNGTTTLDKYVSTSGNLAVTEVSDTTLGRTWKGIFICNATCAATGRSIKISGSFELPVTYLDLPIQIQ